MVKIITLYFIQVFITFMVFSYKTRTLGSVKSYEVHMCPRASVKEQKWGNAHEGSDLQRNDWGQNHFWGFTDLGTERITFEEAVEERVKANLEQPNEHITKLLQQLNTDTSGMSSQKENVFRQH